MSESTDWEIDFERAAAFFSALGNPKRLEVLCILSEKEVGVNQLAEVIGVSQSSLSQHLAKLKKKGLVQSRRSAQQIYYRCESKPVRQMLRLLETIFVKSEPKIIGLFSIIHGAATWATQEVKSLQRGRGRHRY